MIALQICNGACQLLWVVRVYSCAICGFERLVYKMFINPKSHYSFNCSRNSGTFFLVALSTNSMGFLVAIGTYSMDIFVDLSTMTWISVCALKHAEYCAHEHSLHCGATSSDH